MYLFHVFLYKDMQKNCRSHACFKSSIFWGLYNVNVKLPITVLKDFRS